MRRRGRRRREPVVVHDDDMVIDAVVRARLLGVKLLELDARVVVAPARRPARHDAELLQPSDDGRSVGSTSAPSLRRATRLLAEGSRALEDARRLA